MGFRFRKSVKAGPFRINFSKRGVGWSVGGKGYRYTKKAGGGSRHTYKTPIKGLNFVSESGARKSTVSKPAARKQTVVHNSTPSSKIRLIALILCIFGGGLGLHHFYVGNIGKGILYLCTAGIFGIMWIVDIFRILNGTFYDGNGCPVVEFGQYKKDFKAFFDNTSKNTSVSPVYQTQLFNQYCDGYIQLEKVCRDLNTDLVVASSHECTCALCSSLQGRVFSLHGIDKRFPLLPEEVKIYGGFHDRCRHSFYPFVYGVDVMDNGENDPIQFSNRPYKDYRTKQQREEYEADVAKEEAQAQARVEYEWICVNLPSIAPKSLNGYSRMKNSNSTNYQKLVEAAKSKGYIIS